MAQHRALRWLLWVGLAAIGRLHLRLGNPLVISAEDVVVSNPPGFPAEDPFAGIPRLALQLDAMVHMGARRRRTRSVARGHGRLQALARGARRPAWSSSTRRSSAPGTASSATAPYSRRGSRR